MEIAISSWSASCLATLALICVWRRTIWMRQAALGTFDPHIDNADCYRHETLSGHGLTVATL